MEKRIPIEAYRYWPKGEDIYTGEGKKIARLIFYKTEFTHFEQDQLKIFKSKIPASIESKLSAINFPDEELIRILISTSFDHKEALKSLSDHTQETPKTTASSALLEEGSIYMHGIDNKYRPLIVINIGRMNLKDRSVKSYCDLLCYILDHTIAHHMIPGQIENWVVITDLCNISTSKLPVKDMKDIIKVLQNNYKCRMAANYIVNAPTGVKIVWGMLSRFINASTVRKVKIFRGVPEELKLQFAENQLEMKYGGSADNAKVFWPVQMPPAPYSRYGEPPHNAPSTFSLYNELPVSEESEILLAEEEEAKLRDSVSVQEIPAEWTPPEILLSGKEDINSDSSKSRKSLRIQKRSLRIVNRKLVYDEDNESFEYANVVTREDFKISAPSRRPNSISCCWFWKKKQG